MARRPIGDVVVVGAGVSGIAAGKAFQQHGCRSLTIFEKTSSMGGHWSWPDNYPGVGVQNHAEAYRFTDKPMACAGRKATAAEVQRYVAEYAREHGLLARIRFGTEVVEVIEEGLAGGRRVVVVRDVATGASSVHPADVVVFAAGFVPSLPECVTAEGAAFRGRVVHSSAFSAAIAREAVTRRQQVVVVGGRKSSSELIAGLRELGHTAGLVTCVHANRDTVAPGFEPQLWPTAAQLPFLMLEAAAGWLTRTSPVLQAAARLLRWPLHLAGLILPAPIGGGQPMDVGTLRLLAGVRVVRGHVVGLTPTGARCSDGQELDADLIVCATGFRIYVPPVSIVAEPDTRSDAAEAVAVGSAGTRPAPRRRLRRCNVKEEQPLLYRSMVFPQSPQLCAILFNSMGINSMLSAEVMAAWLANFYSSGLAERSSPAALAEQVAADVAGLRERGGDGSFSTWQFDRGANLKGGKFDKGADFAADFYEEQIYADLDIVVPSRFFALTRAQHDEKVYRRIGRRLTAIAEQQ